MNNIIKYQNGELAWKFIDYSKIREESGELGVIEFGKEIDFEVKRVFYLRAIDSGSTRGFHAHCKLKQFIFCVNGSFTIELDNGENKFSYILTPDSAGLLVDGKVWREMHSFSGDSVMIVLCDMEYRFDTVIRDYDTFQKNITRKKV